MEERPIVVATGFGPFGSHVTNDSWTAVQLLKESNLEDELGIHLVIKELPVCYKDAERTIPTLWDLYKPLFMLHVGIHKEKVVKLETGSRRSNYHFKDIVGECPKEQKCFIGSDEHIKTELDLKKVLKACEDGPIEVHLSDDPGNFLCGYTYYLSLCHDSTRTLFVHIPPPESEINVHSKAEVLQTVLINAVNQLTNVL